MSMWRTAFSDAVNRCRASGKVPHHALISTGFLLQVTTSMLLQGISFPSSPKDIGVGYEGSIIGIPYRVVKSHEVWCAVIAA